MIEIELAHHVPLVCCPLRRGMRSNFGGIVFEWKAPDIIGTQNPRIEPNILIPCFFRGMLFGIAPSQLHGSRSSDGRVRDVVRNYLGRNLSTIDIYLHSRSSARAVVSEKNMFPCAVERKRSERDDTDRNWRSRILGRFSRRMFLCLGCAFCLVLLGRFRFGF